MQRYESYKRSGVEWLTDIPSHWEAKKLKFVVNANERTLPENTPKDLKIRYVDIGAVSQGSINSVEVFGFAAAPSRARRLAKQGDTIVSTVRTYLKAISVVDEISSDYVYSTGFCILSPRDGLRQKYLAYFCQSNPFTEKVVAESTGVSFPAITAQKLCELRTSIPPLTEQIRIVKFLEQKTSEIESAIAKKERLIELLQEQEDILISQAVTRGVNPNVTIRDSGVAWIGQVPVHWKQLANRALFRERMEPGQADLPILSVSIHTGVSNEEQDGTENIRAKIRIEDKTSYKRVRPGDVTYNMMRAWQGAIGVVRVDGLVSPAYVVAAPLATINGAYFEYLYRTHGFIREMDRYSKGITDFRKRLYWDEFKQLVSLLPPLDEQIQIAAYAEQVITKTSALTEKIRGQIDALNEFRASLIEDLVTGKIKV